MKHKLYSCSKFKANKRNQKSRRKLFSRYENINELTIKKGKSNFSNAFTPSSFEYQVNDDENGTINYDNDNISPDPEDYLTQDIDIQDHDLPSTISISKELKTNISFTLSSNFDVENIDNYVDTELNQVYSMRAYFFQFRLFDVYKNTEKYIKPSTLRDRTGCKPSLKTMLALLSMKFKNNLSNPQGLSIINTMKSINKLNRVKVVLPLSFDTLNSQFNNHIYQEINFGEPKIHRKIFNIINYQYYLDSEIFPNLQLKHPKASSYDIIEVISEALLNIDSQYFVADPDGRFTTTFERIYEDWGTADQAQNIFLKVREISKNNKAVE
jgi:hypothetical protein